MSLFEILTNCFSDKSEFWELRCKYYILLPYMYYNCFIYFKSVFISHMETLYKYLIYIFCLVLQVPFKLLPTHFTSVSHLNSGLYYGTWQNKDEKCTHSNTIGDYLEGWGAWHLAWESAVSPSASPRLPLWHKEHISQRQFSLENYKLSPLLSKPYLPYFSSTVLWSMLTKRGERHRCFPTAWHDTSQGHEMSLWFYTWFT